MPLWPWRYRYRSESVFLFPLDVFPEVKLLDNMLAVFLILWGSSILFSIMIASIYSPCNNLQAFPFLHIHTSSWFLDVGHSKRHEVASPCGFNFRFPNNYWCWVYFQVPVGLLHYLCSNVYTGPLSIFIRLLGFIFYWVVWVLYIS